MNNYSPHHKKIKRGLFTKTFTIILFAAGILIAVAIFFPNLLSNGTHFVSIPFWKVKNSITEGLASSAKLLASKKALVAENRNLRKKIEEAKFKLLEAQLLKQENISLKELFNRQILDVENTILAAVLAKPPSSLYDTFVIDVGSDAGIRKGDNVVAFGNIFIGTVDKVNRSTSVVKLFSSPGELTTVSIGEDNITANAEGKGGGNFIVKLPRGIGIEKGDIVTIPNINARIFAVVEKIESDPSDPFLTALFKNPVNMNNIKWVQVVTQ